MIVLLFFCLPTIDVLMNIHTYFNDLGEIHDKTLKGNYFEHFCLAYLKYLTRNRKDITIILSSIQISAGWQGHPAIF